MTEPDTPPDLGPDSLCALCVAMVWKYLSTDLETLPIDDGWKERRQYPSKIIASVLAGTHTAYLRSSQEQLSIRAVTMWKGSPLCPSHAAQVVDREHLSFLHSSHSYGGYRR